MAYSGIGLPGIVCPDESVEQFAKLYGNDHVSKMMIMASTLGNPYDLPGKPQPSVRQPPVFKDGRTPGYYSNINRPAHVNDRNLKVNPQYDMQAFQGSRTLRHGGYGDHYNPSPAMEHRKPEYFPKYAHQGVHHQQEGFGYPRVFQGSRATKHGGYGDHYSPSPAMEHHKSEYFSRYTQQGTRYPAHEHQYTFPPPPGPRFPWL